MLYIQVKKRHKNPFLLEEDESIWPCMEAVSAFSCHMRGLKQREQASANHVVSLHSNDLYVEKLKWVYIGKGVGECFLS